MALESQPLAPKTPPRSTHLIDSDTYAVSQHLAAVRIESKSVSDTPIKPGTHRTTSLKRTVQNMRQTLKLELKDGIISADSDYHENVFASTQPEDAIEEYIQTASVYEDNRWCKIPVSAGDEKELYAPFFEILQDIFEHFDYPTHGRVVLDTHAVRIPHKDGSNTAPDFMVMGLGPNFPTTEDEDKSPLAGCYRRCASVIDVKTHKNKHRIASEIQVATYARQCFIEQQNRRFVYAIILTEVNMRLYIFDRSGGMRSERFNIHENPHDFVRVVLGFCSPEGEEIGFDTSISWKKAEKEKVEYKGAMEPDVIVDEQNVADLEDGSSSEEESDSGEEESKANEEEGEPDEEESESGEEENEVVEEENEVGEEESEEEGGAGQEYKEYYGETEENYAVEFKVRTKTDMDAKKRQQEEQQKVDKHYDQFIRLNNHWDQAPLEERTYRVKYPLFSRDSLRGRGTKCWAVFDPDNEERTLIIKDSWRTSRREPESKLLAEVTGLPGVGQMVAYQDDGTDRVSRFRKVTKPESIAKFKNLDRTFSRIALEAYGKPLTHFKDRLQLLYAFRDAVKGHRNLWERGILHRDVSLNNLLLGKDGASDGYRGILIDLDMAIRINRDSSLEGTFRTGTRAFQSISVLLTEKHGEYAHPHDYLDDLESYFYCLAMICSTYTGPGKIRALDGTELVKWEDDDLGNAANAKKTFLLEPDVDLTPYFQCFSAMFHSMGQFLHKFAITKGRAARERRKLNEQASKKKKASNKKRSKKTAKSTDSEAQAAKFKLPDLMGESQKNYDTFIGFIDQAIIGLLPPGTNATNPEPIAPSTQPLTESCSDIQFIMPSVDDPTRPSRKRGANVVESDSESPQKKGRHSAFGLPEH